MNTSRDQNDRLRDGDLPDDPMADAMPVPPNTAVRRLVAASSPSGAPADVQAEATMLGTLLWCGANAPGSVPLTAVVDLVPTGDVFHVPAHALIFAAMATLAESGKPIDKTTVHSELVRNRRDRAIGGIVFLENLVTLAEEPSIARVRVYAQAIRDAWLRRRVLSVAHQMIETCTSGAADAGETVARAVDALRPIGEAVVSDAGVTSLTASLKKVISNMTSGVKAEYFPTGFEKLDGILGGLYPRETTIVAARTSIGKTALTTQIMRHIVKQNPKAAALYVTLEMPADSFSTRMLATEANVDSRWIRRNEVQDGAFPRIHAAALELAKLKIFFAQSQSQTLISIHAMAKARAQALALDGHRLVLIVIDHIGLVKSSGASDRRHEQVAETSRGLRFLAEQHGCHVIALCQIKREADKRKGDEAMPSLSELKESSAIEDDADNVIILHRARDKRGQIIDGPAWVSVAKGRNDGTGIFQLGVEPKYLRFSDWFGEEKYG